MREGGEGGGGVQGRREMSGAKERKGGRVRGKDVAVERRKERGRDPRHAQVGMKE